VNVGDIDVPDGNPSIAANLAWLFWPLGAANSERGFLNQRLEVAEFISTDGTTCNKCVNPYQDSSNCQEPKYQGHCPGTNYWTNVCSKDTWDSIKNGKACFVVDHYGK
jgi:hypothetical protein